MMEQRLIPPYPFWAHAIAVPSSPPKPPQSAGAGPPLGRGGLACPALRLQCARSAIAGQAHSKRTHHQSPQKHSMAGSLGSNISRCAAANADICSYDGRSLRNVAPTARSIRAHQTPRSGLSAMSELI